MVTRRTKMVPLSVLLTVLVLAAAAQPAAARSVEIWVGESARIHANRKQIEPSTVTATSDKPKIAAATWGGGDTGPVIIVGLDEGTATVTVTGDVRLRPVRKFTETISVTVKKAVIERRAILSQEATEVDVGPGQDRQD